MVQKLFAIQEGTKRRKLQNKIQPVISRWGFVAKCAKTVAIHGKPYIFVFFLNSVDIKKKKKDVFRFFPPKCTFYEINFFVRTKQFVIPPKERCYHRLFLSVFALRKKSLVPAFELPDNCAFCRDALLMYQWAFCKAHYARIVNARFHVMNWYGWACLLNTGKRQICRCTRKDQYCWPVFGVLAHRWHTHLSVCSSSEVLILVWPSGPLNQTNWEYEVYWVRVWESFNA